MLRDRRVLVEAEIRQQRDTAAKMYLDIVRGTVVADGAYSAARDRIAELEHDLVMIQHLLDQGHE